MKIIQSLLLFVLGLLTTNFLINNFTSPVLGQVMGTMVFSIFFILAGLDYLRSLIDKRTQMT